jgi:hypothetical protein
LQIVKQILLLIAVVIGQSVLAADKARSFLATGTGFFVTADGYLLTNYHVVDGASRITIKINGKELPAKVIKSDKLIDLAVLKVAGKFSALPIVSSRKVGLGDEVFTIGFPQIAIQGVRHKLTKGSINGLAGIKDDPSWFQISVPIQPGNSGGPLVDEYGNVVGVVVARLNALKVLKETGRIPQNVNYAVKGTWAMAFLKALPAVASKIKDPILRTKTRKFSDVVKEVQAATVLILVRGNFPITAIAPPATQPPVAPKPVPLTLPTPPASIGLGVITGTRVSARGKATVHSQLVFRLRQHEPVNLLEEITLAAPKAGEPRKWYRVQVPPDAGLWVHPQFLHNQRIVNIVGNDGKPSPHTYASVKPNRLNVHGGAGDAFPVLGQLPQGTDVALTGAQKGKWLEIFAPANCSVYVRSEFVKIK